MAERKIVGRKVAILLGLACIILAAGMVVALVAYLPAVAKVNSLNTEIMQRDQTIATLNLQIASLRNSPNNQTANNSDTTTLQTEIADLQTQVQSLYNVLYLNATGVLVSTQTFDQEPSTNVTIWDGSLPLQFAGFVTVHVQSSSNQTFVELTYASYGTVYDNVVTLGNGTASFPVLPGSVIIMLGNMEPTDRVTGTMTTLYHY